MSSTRHAVVRGPSFTLLGKRPEAIPAHQVDLDTGIICRTWGKRRKPLFPN